MPGKIRLKPANADAVRMYIRKERSLNITAKTLEDALRRAQLQPIKTAKARRTLTGRTGVVVAQPSSPEKPKTKKVWSVGRRTSGSVLRPEVRPWIRKQKENVGHSPKVKAKINTSSRPKSNNSPKPNNALKPAKVHSKVAGSAAKAARSSKKKSPRILPYDGQRRFESGIRIVQGGSPGLGKRR
jgi:hypothetical protein